jgi:(R,R)-butanediol dehydrogenase / meso-butanediol dehydrogenase / diacetyl reductase
MKARRDIATKCGAAAAIDPIETDPGKTIGALTDGLRADIAFDCVGNQAAFDTAVRVTGRRGVICVVGLALKPIEVPFIRLWGHEKELTFSSGYENEFPAAIAYLADGRVRVETLISDRIQLDDIVAKGIQPLIEEGEKHIKVLVYP